MTYDFVIVGAGPVGLCLALRLAKANKRVLVLEKNPTTHKHSRAPAIWPKTQEILADLGVIDTFLKEGIVIKHPSIWDADRNRFLIRIPLEKVSSLTHFPQLLIIPQSKTEKLLAEALHQAPSADVKFSCELQDFTQDDDGVRIQYLEKGISKTATATFLIGCDGAHSTVRELLDIHLEGETYSTQAALADVEIETDLHSPAISTHGVIVIAINIDTNIWRLILIKNDNEAVALEDRIQQAMNQLFPNTMYKDVWSSEFRLHNRISTCFVKGRVALAGDAAHLNSPVGGQGMNAGIQDTQVLGTALLKALHNNDPSCLQEYDAYRKRAVTMGVNRFTNLLTKILFLGNGRFLKVVMQVWNLCIKIPFVQKRFLQRITMLHP